MFAVGIKVKYEAMLLHHSEIMYFIIYTYFMHSTLPGVSATAVLSAKYKQKQIKTQHTCF